MNPIRLKHWHPFIGVLHFLLAVFTTTSMLSALFVPSETWVLIHGISGCVLVLIVTAHWAWNFCYQSRVMLRHLFPLQKELRNLIWEDLRNLAKMKLPVRGRLGGLPGITEGLGLLAVTAMVLTGPFLFGSYLAHGNTLLPSILWLLDVHNFLATFVWIYWCGHVGMALLTFYLEKKNSGGHQ